MKRAVLIIQARMGSRRLPGKSMMDLAGAPLVGRILERVKHCQSIDEIVLAIPDTQENQPLYDLGLAYGVTVYMGAEDDVLSRYYHAATLTKADIVLRLPADNPVPEPREIDRIVAYHYSLAQPGFSSNLAQIHASGYPDGIGAEVFDYCLLEDAYTRAVDPRLREHVHLNFFDYTTQHAVDDMWCPVNTIPCPIEFRRPDLILDVNTLEQYHYMLALYTALHVKNPLFHITDIIKWHDTVHVKTVAEFV